jgi:hypothetical protein
MIVIGFPGDPPVRMLTLPLYVPARRQPVWPAARRFASVCAVANG